MGIYRPKTVMAEPPKKCVKCGNITRTGHKSFYCYKFACALSVARNACARIEKTGKKEAGK
jgi:hypothetical protein